MCAGCGSEVRADAYAIRSKAAWYHLHCASERDERERSASERFESDHQPARGEPRNYS